MPGRPKKRKLSCPPAPADEDGDGPKRKAPVCPAAAASAASTDDDYDAADDGDPRRSPAALKSDEGGDGGDGDASSGPADAETDADGADDASASAAPKPPPRPPNPYDDIKRAIVVNDGTRQNLIRLIGLKSLFAKQLPKMPKEYITRLVFDRRHTSLALLSNDPEKRDCDEGIIGGVCFRAYKEMRFAEIAFFAVSASQQVKGYGTKLMNLFKVHAVEVGIEYFITYADNYAIGYFKKQGFTKAVTMPKGRYHGLIKDYDGGTVMECYVHPSIDYTRVKETVAAQREFILRRIRALSKSDKVAYQPLPRDFAKSVVRARDYPRGPLRTAELALAIPGVVQAGWTRADLLAAARGDKDTDQKKHQLKSELLSLVNKVSDQQFSWCFRDPVNTEEVKDYLDVIADPIDLKTMEKRVRKGDWYKSKAMLYSDMMRMVSNCKRYNGEGSTYYDYAVSLEKYLGTIFPKRVTKAAAAAAAEGAAKDGG